MNDRGSLVDTFQSIKSLSLSLVALPAKSALLGGYWEDRSIWNLPRKEICKHEKALASVTYKSFIST